MSDAWANNGLYRVRKQAAVEPHATDPLPRSPTAVGLYVGTAGDVQCIAVGDTDAVVYKNVPSAFVIAGEFTHVVSTLTTATDILALY